MKNIDWSKLGFGYFKTDYNVRCEFKDGKWGELYTSQDENVNIHMASTCLHYGQEVFEGLKAFRGKDGKVRLFRVEENAKRMINSGSYLKMAVPTVEMFTKACIEAVKLNAEYIPPYGSGASLYLRPMLIGVGPQVGVHPSKDYMFIVFVTPVGRTTRTASTASRSSSTTTTTVQPPRERVTSRSAVTMQPASTRARSHTTRVMPA